MSGDELAIFGGRGGGELVAEYARSHGHDGPRIIGFLNDVLVCGHTVGDVPVIGSFNEWRTLQESVRFVAPLHKVKEMESRARVIKALGIPEARWATVTDRRAAIASTAVLEAGTVVGPFCDVQVGSRIGRHVAIRSGSYVSHDVSVSDFAFIGARVVLCGYVQVGEGAHIAPGAVIRDQVNIGRYAVVGLGAVVTRDVPDFTVFAGVSARQAGKVASGEDTG